MKKLYEMLLHVKVEKGRDLPKMDLFGTCDPYCLLWLESKPDDKRRTSTISQSSNCVWRQAFHFPVTDCSTDILHIEVYDRDRMTADDLVGSLIIPVSNVQPRYITTNTYELTPSSSTLQAGKLELTIQLAPRDIVLL